MANKELILTESDGRFVLFPIQHEEVRNAKIYLQVSTIQQIMSHMSQNKKQPKQNPITTTFETN